MLWKRKEWEAVLDDTGIGAACWGDDPNDTVLHRAGVAAPAGARAAGSVYGGAFAEARIDQAAEGAILAAGRDQGYLEQADAGAGGEFAGRGARATDG